MALGIAGTWLQQNTPIRRLGMLSAQPSIANELCEYIYAQLGVKPEILGIPELGRIDVLVVAESTIGAAIQAVERVRQCGYRMPLMVVAADDHPAAIARALAAGADDFVDVRSRRAELPQRLTAIRRRASGIWTRGAMDTSLDLECATNVSRGQNCEERAPDSTRGIIVLDDVRIVLTARQFAILQYLKARPRTWVTASELLTMVCDCPLHRDSTLVRVHLSAIRKKLGRHAHLIESRRTYGYRWVGVRGELP